MKNLHDTKKFIRMIINYTLDEIIIHQIKYLYIQMKNLYSQMKNLYIQMKNLYIQMKNDKFIL